jgi:gliding motility-associated-like protein
MNNWLRTLCLLCFCIGLLPARALGQCVGLPPVSSLGSNKFPVGLCAPVHANITYNVTFTSPVPAGTLALVYEWGDGSPAEVITLEAGKKTYSASRIHDFPDDSDCEYHVEITIKYNNKVCTTTRQLQKVASWRTDEHNGGKIKLSSPVTGNSEHIICEGNDISVIFGDHSDYSCNAQSNAGASTGAIESPNEEYRWQQIVYNTSSATGRIPNLYVGGVAVTDSTGSDLLPNYQDPRGVSYMAAPVVVNDERRRSSLPITAAGGYGPGFPKAGDVFELTLRYWNFCNPYDDPNIEGPPVDVINGDHPPAESKAVVRIQAAPAAPKAASSAVCYGLAPSAFSVTDVPANTTVKWYENVSNPDRPGKLLSAGKATTFPFASHPAYVNNSTPGIYKVWVSYVPNIAGAVVCEGPKTLVTRSIRESLVVPDPVVQIPAALCNNASFTVTMPVATVEPAGGPTYYSFTGSGGVSLVASTATSADFSVRIPSFGTALYVDRTVTINRQYTAAACPKTRSFTIRIYKPTAGGKILAVEDVCETTPLPTLHLAENIGNVVRWEVKKDNGDYIAHTETIPGTSLSPGKLSPGLYTFRAVVANGTCAEVYSTEEQVRVFNGPVATVFAGADQFICTSLSSVSLGASDPSPGTGTWSYISSVPSGRSVPVFAEGTHDPNTSVSITSADAGAYILRWTVAHGPCISYDDVVVDFGTDPTVPDAGKDKAVCGPSVTLTGNRPEKGLGQWHVISGPDGCGGDSCRISIADPASPESAVELQGPAYRYGSYTLRWSISSGGNNCFLKNDDVVITFDKPAQITTSDSVSICLDASNLTPVHLSGTITGSTAAEWVNVSGKGTVSSSTITASGIVAANYEPAYEDYAAGSPVRLKLRAYPEGSTSCVVEERIVTLYVDRKPVARVGASELITCADTIILNALQPSDGAIGKWTTTNQAVTIDDTAYAHTVVRNLPSAPGNSVVQWTLTSARGGCVSEPVSVTITRASLPTAISLKQAECVVSESSMTTVVMLSEYEDKITTLPAGARDIRWYRNSASSSGSAVADPRKPETGVAEGQVYVARIRDTASNCVNDATVTITIRPLPEAKDALVKVCETVPGSRIASGIDLQEIKYREAITTDPLVTVTWHASEADARLNVSPITSPLEADSIRSVFARVMQQGSTPACAAVARLTIMVSPRPKDTTLYGLGSFCLGDAAQTGRWPIEIYQVTPVSGAQYYWELADSSGIAPLVFGGGEEHDFFMMLQFQHAYKGKVKVRVELNGCSGPGIEKTIDVFQTTAMPVITGVGTVTENQQNVPFKVVTDNTPSSSYAWEIHRASDQTPGGAFLVAGQSTGSIAIDFLKEDVLLSVRENNNGCSSPVATKKIHVRKGEGPAVVAAFQATPMAGCFPVNITLQNTSTGADGFLWKVYDNQGSTVTTSNLSDPVFRIVNPGTYTVLLIANSSLTGEEDSALVKGIAVFDVPTAELTVRTPVYVPETELKLFNYSQRANVYTWNFGDGSVSSEYEPRHIYTRSGTYTVTLVAGYDHGSWDTDGDGIKDSNMVCYDSASQEVVALDGSYMEIPNAFTPSIYGPSGGIPTPGSYNDVFLPLVKNVITFRLQVFDRWGTLVFESNDKNVGWDGYSQDGKLLPAGVYIYKFVLDLMNGQRTNRMGDVTLIR